MDILADLPLEARWVSGLKILEACAPWGFRRSDGSRGACVGAVGAIGAFMGVRPSISNEVYTYRLPTMYIKILFIRYMPQIAIAIGVLTSNRGGGRRTTVADWTWRQGAIAECSGRAAMAGCQRCRCSVLWWGKERVTTNLAEVDVMRLLHAIARCQCRVRFYQIVVDTGVLTSNRRGCHCWVPLAGAIAASAGCHC